MNDATDSEKALAALAQLAPHRADDRDSWLRVGMALHSVADDLLPAWDGWSTQSGKYKAGECAQQWRSFKAGGGITLGTLLAWAREDSGQPSATESRPAPKAPQAKPKKVYATLDAAISAMEPIIGGKHVWTIAYPGQSQFHVARFNMPETDPETGKPHKQFRPFFHNGVGWVCADPPGKLPLYRGDELPAEGTLWVFEGERCADTARENDLLAVTSSHGCGSAHKSDWTPLAGREVNIAPDNDKSGLKYAYEVAAILTALGCTVRIVVLPDLPEHGDIADWVSADGPMGCKSADEIRELLTALADAAPIWTPTPRTPALTGDPQAIGPAPRPDAEIVVKSKSPVPLANAFLGEATRGNRLLRRHRGEFFRTDGSCWRPMTDEALDVEIYRFLARVVVEQVNPDNGEVARERISAKSAIVREIRLALPSCRDVLLDDRIEAPCWLDGDAARPDPRQLFVFRNGYLDLATCAFYRPNPMLFTLSASDFDYAPDASLPQRWIHFLTSIWGDDVQSVELFQDWQGYLLSNDTRQQKILLNVGPKRSGKGTIARVTTELLGRDNCCSPTLASLSQNFGLQPIIHARAAFISDARLSSRADQAVIAERLLSISGEDRLTVDRKYLPPWTGRIGARFTIMTNELPRLGDASGALSSRFLLLKMTKSFYAHEDHRLTDDLLAELPGTFHWAWAGWKRLQSRGRFVMPGASADALQELEDLTSPVAAFVRDECTTGPGHWIECGALYARWTKWCEAQGRVHAGNQATFGRDLAAAIPTLRRIRKAPELGERFYAYDGIK